MDKLKFLDCGCIVDGGSIDVYCRQHFSAQPREGDPLYTFFTTKEIDPVHSEFITFNFFNDGRKPVLVRITPQSAQDNPTSIGVGELVKLKLRPKGFVKLWDYENQYHLLVE